MGSLLPGILELAVPYGLDDILLLQAPHLHPDRVYHEVRDFLHEAREQHTHVIFTDFEGILSPDDSAPRQLTGLMRDCHSMLEDMCSRFHH